MAGRLQDDDISETHEINVTPFIDVMLVLLIIFMVVAPLSTVDVPVELPVSAATPAAKPDKPLYVTLKADLSLAVGNDLVLWGGLGPALDAQTSNDRNKRLFLRADKAVPYGELMRLMDTLRAAGYLKVALVGLEGPPVQGAGAAPAASPAASGAVLPSAPPAAPPAIPSSGAASPAPTPSP
jgi:biopolymer transport protein ExbD